MPKQVLVKEKINVSTEQFWLHSLSGKGLEECSFPWDTNHNLTEYSSSISLTAQDTETILKACKDSQEAIASYFLAAFSFVLARYTGSYDLVINVGIKNHILPLRFSIDGSLDYLEHLKTVRRAIVEGLHFTTFSRSQLGEKLQARGKFEAAGALEMLLVNFEADAPISPGQFKCVFNITKKGTFQLDTSAVISPGRSEILDGYVESCENILLQTKSILHSKLADIDILPPAHKEKVLEKFNKGFKTSSKRSFFELFDQVVKNRSFSRSLLYNDQVVTYEHLDRQSRQIANALFKRGVTRGTIVAIMMAPSPGMVYSVLGVLRAGAAFLPVDIQYPTERIHYMLQDSQASLMLTSERYNDKIASIQQEVLLLEEIDESPPTKDPSQCIVPSDLAYVIYTSGTTGTPNGVTVTHEALTNLCTWHNSYYKLRPDDLSTKYAGFGFDASIWEIFPVLASGGALYVVEEAARNDIQLLNDQFLKYGVTCSFLPTQVGEQFMTLENDTLQKLLLGGDRVKKVSDNVKYAVYNNYGPTENTVVSTAGRIDPGALEISIGKPIETSKIFIFSPGYQYLQPVGVVGELCISGSTLAQGYLNNEGLTKEKFVDHPLIPGERMYKTGDLAKWRVDGNIDFLGRIDNQVKLRGYRIELGEIEKALVHYPGLTDAVVVKKEQAGDFLCAYYLGEKTYSFEELSEFLMEKLPSYMVPSLFVRLNRIPFTANNKVDRKQLEKKKENRLIHEHLPPKNEKERIILNVWQEVLGTVSIGVTDNFFYVGGDSIKAMQIQSRLLRKGYFVKAKSIFEFPTVRELSLKIDKGQQDSQQNTISGPVMLTPIQRQFFEDPGLVNRSHFNQAVLLELKEQAGPQVIQRLFKKILKHHDALRMTFNYQDGKITQYNRAETEIDFEVVHLKDDRDISPTIIDHCNHAQRSIYLKDGPLVKLVFFQGKSTDYLGIIIHHLVVDGVSWRILLEDLDLLIQQQTQGNTLELPYKSDSFQNYALKLADYVRHITQKEKDYWRPVESKLEMRLFPGQSHDLSAVGSQETFDLVFDEALTAAMLNNANRAYGTEVIHLLMSALGNSLGRISGNQQVPIWLEGHGRQEIVNGLDVSRTVGWFTTIFPLLLPAFDHLDIKDRVIQVKEAYEKVPNKGIGYGLLKWNEEISALNLLKEVTFNYLGQFDQDIDKRSFRVSNAWVGDMIDPKNAAQAELDVTALVANKCLRVTIKYHPARMSTKDVEYFAKGFETSLREMVDHCCSVEKRTFTPSDFTYPGLSQEKVEELAAKYDLQDVYTLAPAQEGMLFHTLVNRSSANYCEQISYEMTGSFDERRLEKSLEHLVQRHEVLRTAFVYKDLHRPLQVVLRSRPADFQYFDLSNSSKEETSETLVQYELYDRKRGFDLSNAPLLRLAVFKTSLGKHYFIWSYHHILMDGWCMGIIYQEFYRIYQSLTQGNEIRLSSHKPYKDYIAWLRGLDAERTKKYWKNYLEGFDKVTHIQFKKKIHNTYAVTCQHLILSRTESMRLAEVATFHQLTLSSVLQTVWAVVLGRYNRSNDVVFGNVVAGRPKEVEGVEHMVGLFINTVPIRLKLNENARLLDVVKELFDQGLERESHQHLGLAEIQKCARLGNELFDHILTIENYPLDTQKTFRQGFQLKNLRVFEQTNYDLNVVVAPGEEMKITFNYNASAFDSFFIDGLKESFEEVLKQFCNDPFISLREISLVSASGKKQLVEFNKPFPATTRQTYLELFNQQVRHTPFHRALIHNDQQITYQALDRRSSAVAAQLLDFGIKKEHVIAVMIDRSVDMVISLLGVLKSGAAFLPIDPAYPQDRIDYIIENSGARSIISTKKYKEKLRRAPHTLYADEFPTGMALRKEPGHAPKDLAYVIYTSGTTGKPNGVMIEHQGLVNLCAWHNRHYQLDAEDISTKYAGLGFDATVWEIFPPLISGGSLYIIEEEARHDLRELDRRYQMHGVTVSFLPTQVGERFMELKTSGLKKLLIGGDKLKKIESNLSYEVYNNYGPTENTVVSTSGKITVPGGNLTIGKPIDTSNAYILDPATLQMQPIGAPGELCFSGIGLAKGYLNNEELTSEKFVQNPHGEGRLYKTGDLARWLPSGDIEFLGRTDSQVKVRGYRIELGEIEATLVAHNAVVEAAAVVSENLAGNHLLFGFYKAKKDVTEGELKLFLSGTLPSYMVPTRLVAMEELPMTPNGKVDKKVLQELCVIPASTRPVPGKLGDVQSKVLQAWQKILQQDKIGVEDNFFDLGGTSLDLIRLSEELSEAFPRENLAMMIFKYPTIGSFATYIKGEEKDQITVKKGNTLESLKNNRQNQRRKRRTLKKNDKK